jgi:hypothetical protein
VRPDQTDPGMNAMPRRERAGSPNLDAVEPGTTWQDIKGRFVDDPAGAIAAAEGLVRRAVDLRVLALQEEAAALCDSGRDDDRSSTEGLRTRLIRYQEYCERLATTRAVS